MSHLGRPDGKVQSKYSMKPIAAELEKRALSLTFQSESDRAVYDEHSSEQEDQLSL